MQATAQNRYDVIEDSKLTVETDNKLKKLDKEDIIELLMSLEFETLKEANEFILRNRKVRELVDIKDWKTVLNVPYFHHIQRGDIYMVPPDQHHHLLRHLLMIMYTYLNEICFNPEQEIDAIY